MKIGIFDSGLGGLIITNAIAKRLPQYDYIYLGDTARVPYGDRSQEAIYHFTQEAVDYLYRQDCELIITACNTVSVRALIDIRKIDIPNYYPDRHAIGVIVPTAEVIIQSGFKRVGIIATASTVSSQAYPQVLKRMDPAIEVFQVATPLLVPLVENNEAQLAEPILNRYLQPLIRHRIDSLVLGCTHYPYFMPLIRKIIGPEVAIIAQDEVMPQKLESYLQTHPEVRSKLSTNRTVSYRVTDISSNFITAAQQILGQQISPIRVAIAKDV